MRYRASFRPKTVFVRPYMRQRFGRLENVCQHWRSWPNQLSFTFN
jgi:hypothetical protein